MGLTIFILLIIFFAWIRAKTQTAEQIRRDSEKTKAALAGAAVGIVAAIMKNAESGD